MGWMDTTAFRAHDPGPAHPDRNARLEAIRDELRLRDLDIVLDPEEPAPVEHALLARVHSPNYIDQLRSACVAGARLDPDTVVSAGSFGAALLAAGAAVGAVRHVLAGRWDRAFCSVRPPGHHASRDRGAGFCLFNNVAIACQAALDSAGVERVAVLDFDAHRGDGTELLLGARSEVLCAGWHQRLHYPGPAAVPSRAIDCPLPMRATSAMFLATWHERVLPALHGFQPDFVLVSAGFDADRRDPYAELAMDPHGFYALTWEIVQFANRHCRGRLVSVLEGGYHLTALAEGVAAHVEALLELPYR